MTPRYAFPLAWLLALSAPTPRAGAAVVLGSAELTYDQETLWRDGSRTASNFAEPFPNDAGKFAGFGPEGFEVRVDRLSGSYANVAGLSIRTSREDYGFRVVFQVDEPTPFTYHRGTPPADVSGWVSLSGDDVGDLFNRFLVRDFSGVLAPGRYTFSGYTNATILAPTPRSPAITTRADIRLSVVPEPAVMLPPAGLLLCLARRRPALRPANGARSAPDRAGSTGGRIRGGVGRAAAAGRGDAGGVPALPHRRRSSDLALPSAASASDSLSTSERRRLRVRERRRFSSQSR
jgi:hypothetical protein